MILIAGGTMPWDCINEDLLEYYQKLIGIRKNTRCLNSGDYTVVVCESSLYGFARHIEDESVYVLINRGERERRCMLPVLEKHSPTSYCSLISSKTYTCKPLEDDIEYYNSDLNEYINYVEMIISGYSLEIIKIKEKK